MKRHSGAMLDTINTIKHYLRALKITTWLHSFDQVHTTPRAHHRHIEDKHFVGILALSKEHVLLDV